MARRDSDLAAMESPLVTSQISDSSHIEQIAKYFLHGFVLYLVVVIPASFAGWMTLALGAFLLGFIGSFMAAIVSALVISYANADICHWLWEFDVKKSWPRLIAQGVILTATIYFVIFLTTPLSEILLSTLSYSLYLVSELLIGAVLAIFEGYVFKSIGALFL